MNPAGPAHTEEGGGTTGGDCMLPCSKLCGSAGCEEKHSLLNPTTHHACQDFLLYMPGLSSRLWNTSACGGIHVGTKFQ